MSAPFTFRPKLFDCMAGYSLKSFGSDLSAGITVGVIALPMAMAFAIGSNVPPEAGLVTAVVAGFLISFLGGSSVSIGGPTGAFVGIVAGIVATYGLSGLLICTMMAGVMLFLMGLLRLGGLIRYIPAPLVKGFTTGIAVIILCGQLKDFLGIRADLGNTSNLLRTFDSLWPHLTELSLPTLAVSMTSVLAILFWPKVIRRYLPGAIGVMLLVTGAVTLARQHWGLDIETIGTRFGDIPRTLPMPQLPGISLDAFQDLLIPALTIALLGAIESLLCTAAADGMTDDDHNPDQELMAQGIANFLTPLFGGIPATGAIARTAANIRSGGKTPVAGIVHALTLFAIMLAAAPLAKYIPLSVLSAVLVVVALNMGDWREFIYLSRYPRADASVFLITFFLTIIFGLTQAVTVGIFAACIFFIKQVSDQSRVGITPVLKNASALPERENNDAINEAVARDDILLVTLTGAMFFGAAQKLKRIMHGLKKGHKVLILRMAQVISLDATAILTLEDIITKFEKRGVPVILVGLMHQPRASLRKAGILAHLPRANVLPTMEEAVLRADEIIEEQNEAAAQV